MKLIAGLAIVLVGRLPAIRHSGDETVPPSAHIPIGWPAVSGDVLMRGHFQADCAGCHGATGLRGGPHAARPSVPGTDVTRHLGQQGDDRIVTWARLVSPLGMPAHGNTESNMSDLVYHLRRSFTLVES